MTRVFAVVGVAVLTGALGFTPTGQAFAPQVREAPPPQNQPTARQVPIGTSSIAGQVTAADTGRPVRGANVNLSATIGTPPSSGPLSGNPIGTLGRGRAGVGASVAFVSRQALTDAGGRFSIERLPAGSYMIWCQRTRRST